MLRRLLLSLALACALPAKALAPDPAGPVVGSLVVQMLERAHYERRKVDSRVSAEFLTKLLESYDYGRLFFTQEDVAALEQAFDGTLASRVRAGDVSAAYAVFDRFKERLAERRKQAQELAAAPMDFTARESLPLEAHKGPWPADESQARERLRLNVKAELLRARLDKSSEPVKEALARFDNLSENYRQFEAGDALEVFFSALCRVYDPHTDYFAPAQEDNFNIGMRLSLVGIGAQLRSEKGYTTVVNLVPGGPADLDKRLRPGDKITGVAQGEAGEFADLVGMRIDRVVKLIRGEKGTVVRLRVQPVDAVDPATRVVIRIVRDEIHLRDQEAKARVTEAGGRRLGVIDLPSFYANLQDRNGKSTTRDVAELLGSLGRKGIEGLVLDLRRNGGGSLQEALALTGLFIGPGPVVQVRDGQGGVTVLESGASGVLYDGPVVVLTSRASASASEILAAALQDYGRAVVVGAKSTFGKGTVQSVVDLDRHMPPSLRHKRAGAVHLTVQKFYRVSGGSTQNRGVVPDVRLPSVEDEADIAESSLPNALPWDRIEPARFSPVSVVGRLLPRLVEASRKRVESSPEWAYVLEDIAEFKRDQEDKALSLVEAERLAEKAADEAREAKRKKERAARGGKAREWLEITLEAPEGVVKSTEPAKAPADGGKGVDYDKAPPPPDLMMEESLNVLAGLVEASVTAR